jgi:hypothetical protein
MPERKQSANSPNLVTLVLADLVCRQNEEEQSEEEVADVAEDVVEVDDVGDGDGAEEVVVAHVGIPGLD